jgi:hypothetical protein
MLWSKYTDISEACSASIFKVWKQETKQPTKERVADGETGSDTGLVRTPERSNMSKDNTDWCGPSKGIISLKVEEW